MRNFCSFVVVLLLFCSCSHSLPSLQQYRNATSISETPSHPLPYRKYTLASTLSETLVHPLPSRKYALASTLSSLPPLSSRLAREMHRLIISSRDSAGSHLERSLPTQLLTFPKALAACKLLPLLSRTLSVPHYFTTEGQLLIIFLSPAMLSMKKVRAMRTLFLN